MATPLKTVIIGDGAVGKTTFLIVYCKDKYPVIYTPTVFENYVKYMFVDATPVAVAFWDTAGEDYPRLRPLCYPDTDVFLLCFSVDNRYSFNNVKDEWVPEVRYYMPDTPIILIGTKSDLRPTHDDPEFVTREEAESLAEELGLISYQETSSLAKEGLQECMYNALRAGLVYTADKTKPKATFRRLFWKSTYHRGDKSIQPPVVPLAKQAPVPKVEASVYAEQWQKSLEDPRHADVTFIIEGKHQLKAHKIVLASTSKFFRKMFLTDDNARPNQLEQFMGIEETVKQLNSEEVPRSDTFCEEHSGTNSVTYIELAPWITGKTFVHVLNFLYTGDPSLAMEISKEELDLVIRASNTFDLPKLKEICMSLQKEDNLPTQTIVTADDEECMNLNMRKFFLNKPQLADLSFKVEGETIWAHKAVLSTRCDVMAAMFSGHFVEGNTSTEIEIRDTSLKTFLILLEYLYTDQAPIGKHTAVDILILADQYCLTRLVSLCELHIANLIQNSCSKSLVSLSKLHIANAVKNSCSKNIQNLDIDVIGLLLTAQRHNANQMSAWCLQFIANNYRAFREHEDFNLLTEDDKVYVEEHQWPPLSYLEQVEKCDALMKEKKPKKCIVM